MQLKLALGGRNVVAVFGMSEAISSDIGSPCFGWGFSGVLSIVGTVPCAS